MAEGTTNLALPPEALARRAELAGMTAALAQAMDEGGLTVEMLKSGLPWHKLRLRPSWRLLFIAQRGLCSVCGEFMVPPRRSGSRPRVPSVTEEHVHPRARGGGGRDARNVVLAHGACNAAKGRRMPTKPELEYARTIWAKVVTAQPILDAAERIAMKERRDAAARKRAQRRRERPSDEARPVDRPCLAVPTPPGS